MVPIGFAGGSLLMEFIIPDSDGRRRYVVQRAKQNERWPRSFTRDSCDRGLHGLCRRRRLGRPWGPDYYRIRSNCRFTARGPSDGGVARSGRNRGDHSINQRRRGVYAGGAASGRVLRQRDSANVSQRVRRHRKRGGVADSRGVDLGGELGDCVGRDGAVLADSTRFFKRNLRRQPQRN